MTHMRPALSRRLRRLAAAPGAAQHPAAGPAAGAAGCGATAAAGLPPAGGRQQGRPAAQAGHARTPGGAECAGHAVHAVHAGCAVHAGPPASCAVIARAAGMAAAGALPAGAAPVRCASPLAVFVVPGSPPQKWVRRRMAQAGLPRPSAVHVVSSTKQRGVRELLSDLQAAVGVRGDVWVVGAQVRRRRGAACRAWGCGAACRLLPITSACGGGCHIRVPPAKPSLPLSICPVPPPAPLPLPPDLLCHLCRTRARAP